MLGSLVYDLLIILAAGLLAGLVCRWSHVSVLVGYLVMGAILGKGGLHWITDEQHHIEYIAEVGVFLLLFAIGLEFALDELSQLGRNLVIGGSVQMLLVAVPLAALLHWAGVSWPSAFLISAAASFSSTVVVFKVLSEWGHSSLPHGQRAIGILLFQDIALIPLLLAVPLLTGTGHVASVLDYTMLAFASVLFVGSVVALRWTLAKWIIPLFTSYRSPELVVLFTLTTLGGVTFLADAVGLPAAIGAFAAGLIFGGNRWTGQVDALILPFRETFAAVFFVSLGLLFEPRLFARDPILMVGLLVGLVALKAAAATAGLRMTKLYWQAAVGMGMGLAHVGEFAFLLVVLGQQAGIINESDYEVFMTLAISSLLVTPLMLKTGLRWASTSTTDESSPHDTPLELAEGQAIVIGAGLIGRKMTSALEIMGRDVCLVDLSLINLHPFAQYGFRTVTGDATDTTILELAGVENAMLVIVCVPDDDAAVRIVRAISELNPSTLVLVRCRYQATTKLLHKAGAGVVVSEEAEASNALLTIVSGIAKVDELVDDQKARR